MNLSSLDLLGSTGSLATGATWQRAAWSKVRYNQGFGESMESRRSGRTSLSVAPRYKELGLFHSVTGGGDGSLVGVHQIAHARWLLNAWAVRHDEEENHFFINLYIGRA
jgi:hypothetical protein